MDDLISITLSRAQVNQVLREAAQQTGIAGALSGVPHHGKLAEAYRSLLKGHRQLSRSLLIGLIVFACFPEDGDSLGINQVARIVGLNMSTTYRYIVTLVAAGLLERDPETRRYHRPATKPHRGRRRSTPKATSS